MAKSRTQRRFSFRVRMKRSAQKAAAQAVPVQGAISGAAVNSLFMDHFQGLAQGHFTVRRLERTYGKGTVRLAYEQIRAGEDRGH